MKKQIFTFLSVLLLATGFIYAQAPEGFNYQAVIRDASGEILSGELVPMRFTIKSGGATGSTQYMETKELTTDMFGMVNHAVGTGTVVSGNFNNITWASNAKYLKVEADIGAGWVSLGEPQKLMSVPYSLEAKNAETAETSLDNKWNVSGSNIYFNDGNVGIGSSNPTAKLHAQGAIRSFNSGALQLEKGQGNGNDWTISREDVTGASFLHFRYSNEVGVDETDGSVMRIRHDGVTRIKEKLSIGLLPGGSDPILPLKIFSETTPYGGDKDYHIKLQVYYGEWEIGVDNQNGDADLIFHSPETSGSYIAYVEPHDGSWNMTSDKKLKKQIEPLSNMLDKIEQLKPVSYLRLQAEDNEKREIGFIAQDVIEVFPNNKIAQKEGDTWSLAYHNFGILAIAGIQELKAEKDLEIEELKEQIEILKKEIEALKTK